MTPEQLELVREYCEYYVHAPYWKVGNPDEQYYQDWAHLREEIKTISTAEKLNAWVMECLNVGIDPL